MFKADGGGLGPGTTRGRFKPQNWMTPPTVIEEEPGLIVVRKHAGASEDRLEIRVAEVVSDVSHDMGEAAALEKEGVERELQELLADAPESCGEGFRLVRREWPTDIGPVDLMCRDPDDGWVAVEIKRVGTIDAVEQLTRYLERLTPSPGFAACRGVLAATQIKPQARVLAESRGIACVEVDPRRAARRARARADAVRGVGRRASHGCPAGSCRLAAAWRMPRRHSARRRFAPQLSQPARHARRRPRRSPASGPRRRDRRLLRATLPRRGRGPSGPRRSPRGATRARGTGSPPPATAPRRSARPPPRAWPRAPRPVSASPNDTATFLGLGIGPSQSRSVPVMAAGTSGAPASIARRAAPRRGSPSSPGSRTRVPSGNSDEQSAVVEDRPCGGQRVGVGLAAPDRERPEPHEQRPFQSSNSSDLPMNRRWRRVAAPMKKESQKLLWLGVITAGPSAGMWCAPVMLRRNHTRKNATTMPRTIA